jgi:glycosyltransferase involved in cell wall biosynthesis
MTTATATPALVSVIVPCRNEELFIQACLESIVATQYPHDRLEVLVVDGRSDDRTRLMVADYIARYPFIRLLDNPGRLPSIAVNIGIRASSGDVLIRLDAHSVYPKTYIPALVAGLDETGASNVGGVLETVPAKPTPIARAIATAMSHPFGVGNSLFRIGTTRPCAVDTVAFFCCRRETFEQIGLFDEAAADEDSDFNARLIRAGGKVMLLPHVVSRYYARSSVREAGRLFYRYGSSKPSLAWKHGRVQTWRQLVPPAFIIAVMALAMLSLLFNAAAILLETTTLAYVLAVWGCSVYAGRASREVRRVAALALVFPVVHLSYGVGVLSGAAKLTYRLLWSAARRKTEPLSTGG